MGNDDLVGVELSPYLPVAFSYVIYTREDTQVHKVFKTINNKELIISGSCRDSQQSFAANRFNPRSSSLSKPPSKTNMAPIRGLFGRGIAIQRTGSGSQVFGPIPTRPQRRSIGFASFAQSTTPRVAVLYQAINPPVINGVTKPRKPGGGSCSTTFRVRS